MLEVFIGLVGWLFIRYTRWCTYDKQLVPLIWTVTPLAAWTTWSLWLWTIAVVDVVLLLVDDVAGLLIEATPLVPGLLHVLHIQPIHEDELGCCHRRRMRSGERAGDDFVDCGHERWLVG